MAFFMIGMFLGMAGSSVLKIPPEKKMFIFILSLIFTDITLQLTPAFNSFIIMLVFVLLGGLTNSILNVFITSSLQLTVPQDMRGKMFGLLGAINQGLTPIAMAIGGVWGEFLTIKLIISSCCIVSLLISLPFVLIPAFKRFINYYPNKETLQDIM